MITWVNENSSHSERILREVWILSILKLKSPVMIISFIPVSTARWMESSIPE